MFNISKNQAIMAGIPQIKLVFDRRKTASATTKGSVEIEVTWKRERIRLSTGVSVLKQQWKGSEVVNHPEAAELNAKIRSLLKTMQDKFNHMAESNSEINLSVLKATRKAKVIGGRTDFLDWLEDRIAKRLIKESTRKHHMTVLKSLREFGKIKTFTDVTSRNIKLWDDYIRSLDKVNCQASVHGYHKRLRPYMQEALELQLIDTNPYANVKIPRGKSEGIRFLSEEERDRIEELELFGMMEKTRDMFIFSCYTGLAYSDLIKIKKEDVFQKGDDYCIRDRRTKTGNQYTIVLLPKALAILRKYNFNLNLLSNQKCNEQLKLIAHMAKIHINLTMHFGRHTFATWALSKGVGIQVVSKMLSHADISMTEKYAQVLQTSVYEGYDLLK